MCYYNFKLYSDTYKIFKFDYSNRNQNKWGSYSVFSELVK